MANGRFSRGVEVIADASLAFVGNIDQSVDQVVNSTKYDLFVPLPKEFDLAVMDRFACYLPGWEMLKNSSEYLTVNYGFITDYIAEAFHYQFAHTNRYEEVSKRIKLGPAVEGRDEKGIKKTVSAFLKILHPEGPPSDVEFEEYVAYAVESRRRVKEQMNKRKPDEEFANINLSYFNAQGQEVVVYCPESKDAPATQQPIRKSLVQSASKASPSFVKKQTVKLDETAAQVVSVQPVSQPVPTPVQQDPGLPEQHFTIFYGATGYSYESIIGPYLAGATAVVIEDPYIRASHQIQNFVRFCEAIVKCSAVKHIQLITSFDQTTSLDDLQDKLNELKQSLLELDIVLDVELNPNLHDREIRIDNGWVVKVGRGLDFYQKPTSWFEIGVNDLSMRKCLETKVDIFRVEPTS